MGYVVKESRFVKAGDEYCATMPKHPDERGCAHLETRRVKITKVLERLDATTVKVKLADGVTTTIGLNDSWCSVVAK